MKTIFAKLVALVLAVGCARSQTPTGNPLAGLERLKEFATMRASSSDPNWINGNRDMRPIEPGATLTVAELNGPGVISHIWFTADHPHPFYSRLLVLRIYWDGEEHPSVESPLGDFFGIGNGLDQSFSSLPVRVTAEGRARNCYWPMPFRRSARITITNESEQRCGAFFYYIDWQKHTTIPDGAAYFHAMYRQEYPNVMGKNYLIADIRGRGHYVGTVQSVYRSSPGWYGEGDDFFFIDGEKQPSLRGTGTEDYFCDAWGFRQQDGPFYGTPVSEGRAAGERTSAYRFHVTDPITFRRSLRVEIEHKGQETFPDGTSTGYIERDDLMSSVAFWYQAEPHLTWAPLPPGPDRLIYKSQTPLFTAWKAEKDARRSDGILEVRDLPGASEGRLLLFTPSQHQGWLELPFTVEGDRTVDLFGRMACGPEGGIYRVLLDGNSLGVVDLSFYRARLREFKWGLRRLSSGRHLLRFECLGKNESSRGYALSMDTLIARIPTYLRPDGFDLRNIQQSPPLP